MTIPEPLTLDVREELRRGGEPLPRIMETVRQLAPGQALRLLATFEPLPLYAVLGRKGFDHQAMRHNVEDWEVLFTPGTAVPEQPKGKKPHTTKAVSTSGWPAPSAFLDNRGLEPPEPMVRILDSLDISVPAKYWKLSMSANQCSCTRSWRHAAPPSTRTSVTMACIC